MSIKKAKIYSVIIAILIILSSLVASASAKTNIDPVPIDDYILVEMKHEYSFPEEAYPPAYFDAEIVEKVETISSYHEGGLNDKETFTRVEKLILSEKGKENIDLFIIELNQREDILCAGRDYEYPNGLAAASPADASFHQQNAAKPSNGPIPIDDYILVSMEHEYSFPKEEYSPEYFDAERVDKVETISSYHEGDLTDKETFVRIEKLYLSEKGKENIELLIDELNQRKDIQIAERDYEYKDGLAMVIPNDTYFNDQYALTKIMAQKAWAITTGSPSMRVGIIDSGIKSTHPDLSTNVDTSLNKNFVNNSSANDDLRGHGTQVAGVLGARGNNTIGISGICWNVKMISLIVSDSAGAWTNARVISAIDYAATKNISIINMSLQDGTYCQTLKNRIADYTGLFVVAAGNLGNGETEIEDQYDIRYPAYYANYNTIDNMIVVCSTDSDDHLGLGSKYHPTIVNLGAPGIHVYTTKTGISMYGYTTYGCTSIAAPYVAGTLALMRSANISLTSAQLKSRLLSSVDSDSWLTELVSTGGRLNAFRAVRKAKGYLMGDADLDHSITPEDARQVLRWAVGSDSPTDLNEALCDVDYSNALEPSDSRLILRMAVGMDPQIE